MYVEAVPAHLSYSSLRVAESYPNLRCHSSLRPSSMILKFSPLCENSGRMVMLSTLQHDPLVKNATSPEKRYTLQLLDRVWRAASRTFLRAFHSLTETDAAVL
jgi:hypothetical protein